MGRNDRQPLQDLERGQSGTARHKPSRCSARRPPPEPATPLSSWSWKKAPAFEVLKALKKADKGPSRRSATHSRRRRLYRGRRERQPDRPEAAGQPEGPGHLRLQLPRPEHRQVIQGSRHRRRGPTFENIAAGKYPVSRPLFFYVKKAHVGTFPASRSTWPNSPARRPGAGRLPGRQGHDPDARCRALKSSPTCELKPMAMK
jgi:hypothetical protein